MLDWLLRFLGWKRPLESQGPTESAVHVFHDETTIRVRQPDGREETLVWADLARVAIMTTCAGPFATDLFWILTPREGGRNLVIPLGATGEHELLKAMQRRLRGFDNMAVIEAMGSTDDASFPVWQTE
jgi:hypothetical protein